MKQGEAHYTQSNTEHQPTPQRPGREYRGPVEGGAIVSTCLTPTARERAANRRYSA